MKGSHKAGQVCGENGQVICEEDQVRVRWKEYFARTRLKMCQHGHIRDSSFHLII